jgi:predicted porin
MMRKYSLSALVAAGLLVGGLSAGSASAADLGGNCCADLEERIAELEATTARKGNRKVSLTISGWVAEQAMYWDDGFEKNLYVTGLGTTLASNVKFTGQATIAPGYYAGYVLHLEAIDSDSLTIDQGVRGVLGTGGQGPAVDPLTQQGTFTGPVVTVLQSFWFLKSDHLGKVSIGRQSQASDNTAILVDGSGSLVPANWVAFETNAFQVYDTTGAATGLIWGAAGACRGMGGAWGDCNGLTRNAIRYDSPTWHGFSVSADWGDDDFWDVAARYSGEFNGFKLSVAAAYDQWSDGNYQNAPIAGSNFLSGIYPNPGRSDYFQLGAYAEHVPTGLWGLVNYGRLDDNFTVLPLTETWYFKAGLRERWSPLGHTVLYGEYLTNNNGGGFSFAPCANSLWQSAQCAAYDSDLKVWGLGAVQEIDAAAMSLWVSYRHLSYNDNIGTILGPNVAGAAGYDDFQYVKFGGLINF